MDTPRNPAPTSEATAAKLSWERPMLRRMDAGAAESTITKRPHNVDATKRHSS